MKKTASRVVKYGVMHDISNQYNGAARQLEEYELSVKDGFSSLAITRMLIHTGANPGITKMGGGASARLIAPNEGWFKGGGVFRTLSVTLLDNTCISYL